MEFVVRKATESKNGGFILTIEHEKEVTTSIGKQVRKKSYATKVLEAPKVGSKLEVDFKEFDIVLMEWTDEETKEKRSKNWLFPK